MKQVLTQEERLDFLIVYLLQEQIKYKFNSIPETVEEKRQLFRSLMNIRPPVPIGSEYLKVQNEYLKERLIEKGITEKASLKSIQPGLYLWKGDITTLAVDAIVNAANRQMLGCFVPCHPCIDNAIHTYSGVQLRLECDRIMSEQQSEEPIGRAKITKAYNLPCRYVLHTVGPVIYRDVSEKDCILLSSCYHACLDLAVAYNLKSVAFCCISTGEFHFPNKLAAEIAIQTVKEYQEKNPDTIEVIFNVFKDIDYEIYNSLLQ